MPSDHLEQLAQPVFYVPWCATVSDVLQKMKQGEREVAAVVNELGETIGILTFEDILDTVFRPNPSRSDRLLDREPIQQVDDTVWHVTGMTSLRRLGRYFEVELPQPPERHGGRPAAGWNCSDWHGRGTKWTGGRSTFASSTPPRWASR